uniref:NADH-ubiquinone oxidoreductase chain 6 n=1 Tax=Trigonopterus sp. 7 AH-2016 TaxID=1903841 RepID=A0A343C434_9CUCU|nr:NADH dehydrogenase subunit 6 [Trigonopterus sp. 7 AH-2016]
MLFSSWYLSFIFMTMNHPLSLGAILLFQTIFMALSTGLVFFNFWFSYILFLIMIGGMLVLFIYMTSIASNEQFYLPKKSLFIYLLGFTIFVMIFMMDKFFSTQLNFLDIFNLQPWKKITFNMNKYFNYPMLFIMISLMFYLFITLIAIVKITDKYLGTFRQK